MRRIISIILATALVCSIITGCAKKENPAAVDNETVQASETVNETEGVKQTETSNPQSKIKASDNPLTNEDAANYEFTRESFPAMDGSTSMVPLGKAVASVLLGESPEDVSNLVSFNRTTQSFRNLKDGICDILIVGEPNAAVFDEMEEEGFEYELEEIATDGLIFVVNKDNPVDNLTTSQIRDIYSGKITNWKEVGGNDAPIAAFQRNEGAGSQALIKKLIMKDMPMTEAPTTLIASEMGELMESVKSYDNSANAIGYSVYYYANDMKKADGLKLISVDGVEPSSETIRSRKYPHLNAYYCVIGASQPKGSPARILYEWMMSRDGQRLVDAEGYVTAKNPDELKVELPGGQIVKTDYSYYRKLAIPENKYTRLSEGEMKELKASKDYGFIYPYAGSITYVDDEQGNSYQAGALKGFFDEQGRLITDPVYNDIAALYYYEDSIGTIKTVPVWVFSRAAMDKLPDYESGEYEPEIEYSFATMDGSFVCNKWYQFIEAHDDCIICTDIGRDAFDSYDLNGNKMLSSSQAEVWKMVPGKYANGDEWIRDVRYGDGLYVINISMDETYYVDESGKTVLGPYPNAWPFKNDRAIAEEGISVDGNNRFGVIDKQGNWIVEPKYNYIDRLNNGSFVCSKNDSTHEIIDADGKRINTVDSRIIETTKFGFTSEYESDEERLIRCNDFTGKVIFEGLWDEWQTVGRDGIMYRQLGAGVQLRNILTGKSLYVEGADQANTFMRLEDAPDVGRIIVRNSYYDDEAGYFYCHERVYDNDLNLLFDKPDVMLMIEDDKYLGDWYTEYDIKGNKVYINDIDFNEVCELYGYPEIVNGKFIVQDDYACTCHDKKGNIVFSFSLLKSIGD